MSAATSFVLSHKKRFYEMKNGHHSFTVSQNPRLYNYKGGRKGLARWLKNMNLGLSPWEERAEPPATPLFWHMANALWLERLVDHTMLFLLRVCFRDNKKQQKNF